MWVGVVGSWGRGRHVSGVRVRSTEEEPRVAVSHGSGARGAPRETGLSVGQPEGVCGGARVSPRVLGVLTAVLLTFGPGSVTRQKGDLGGQTANNLALGRARRCPRLNASVGLRSFSRPFPFRYCRQSPSLSAAAGQQHLSQLLRKRKAGTAFSSTRVLSSLTQQSSRGGKNVNARRVVRLLSSANG